MRLLLDSHALIWALDRPEKLGTTACKLLKDPSNDLCFSSATIWEIAIKVGIKKLSLSVPFKQWMEQAIAYLDITTLPITISATDLQVKLPVRHRDPFDRLLVAQAMVENMGIITKDKKIICYDVETYW